MGVIYKLKDEVRDFILEQKRVNPAIGCRTLAALAQDKFQVKLSKSSVNAIIKTAGMSMPVGRRVKDISKERPVKFIPEALSEELGRAAEPEMEEKAKRLESEKWALLAEEERRRKMSLDRQLEEEKRALEERARKKEAVSHAAEDARRAETEARKRLEEDRRLLAQAKKAREEKGRQEESLRKLEEARRKDMERQALAEAKKKIEEQARLQAKEALRLKEQSRAAQAAAEHVVLEAAHKAAEEISGKIEEDKRALEEARRSVDALAKEVEEERKALELEHQARQEVIRDAAEARKILEEAHRRESALKALGEELKRKQEALAKAGEELRLQEEREKIHFDEARQSLTEGQLQAEAERVRIEAERKRMEEERLDLQEARKSVEELTRKAESEKSALEEARKAQEQGILQAQEAKRAAEAAKQEAEEAARKEIEEVRRQLEEEKRAIEEVRRQAEEEARRKALENAELQAEEEAKRKALEQGLLQAQEAKRAAEAARKEAEEAARKEIEEARRQLEEEKRAIEEARRQAEEEAKCKALEDAKVQAEEESKRKALELAKQQAEEQSRREKEEQARQEKEEQARKSQEEAAAKQAEEKPAQPAQSAESRRMQEEEAARLAEADKWRHLAEEERLKKEAAQKSEADSLDTLKSQIKSAAQPASSAPAAADQKCSGIVILKAAEALVGASRAIAEAVRSRAGRQKNELAALIGEAVLSGISPDTSGKSDALLTGFQADKTITPDISSVLKSSLQEVRCIKLQLSDGSSFFIDGQMYTVWSTQNIPYDFSGCFNNVKGYINKYFHQNLPFTLFTAPGYDTPTKEFFSLLMSLEGKGSAVSKLTLYGNKFEELEIMSFDQPRKRFYIFGFFPWQFSEQRKVNKIGEFKPVPFAALGRQLYVADVDLTLSQPALGQSVQLRGCALKLSPQDKARQIIVSNIPPDAMNTEELANAYLGHWPNIEEAFQDYSRKVELFTYTVDSQRYFSVESLNLGDPSQQDPGKLFAGYLEALDSYVRWHFLPTGFETKDMAFTKASFYSLEAVLSRQQDNMVVTFQPPSGYAYLKELQYLARRVNEREVVLADGSRLWLIA